MASVKTIQPSRPIHVALIDESSLWKTISPQIFSNYYFELPSFPKLKDDEKSAKMVINFIPYEQSLVAYNDVGKDPFKRPYLYLYVVDIKNDEISTETIENINKWIENNKILSTTYMVILIQEDRKMFGTMKPINIEQITGSTDDNDDIKIFAYKQRKPIPEQLIEEVRNSTKEHLISDCQKYQNETRKKLKHPSQYPKLNSRLNVWSNLLLLFYGLYDSALKGFTKNYNKLLKKSEVSLDELIKTKIDPQQITDYPFTEKQEPIDSLMFAFYGAMTISYTITFFDNMVTLFFKHFSFIRSLCVTPEDHVKANLWGEEAIDTLLKLGEISSQPSVTSKLLFKKFLLVEERDGPELESIYRNLCKIITSKFETIALKLRFLNWQKKKGKDTINFDESKSIGWNCIANTMEIKFKEALQKEPLRAFQIGATLIKDKSNFQRKLDILKEMIKMDHIKALPEPFSVNIQASSSAFEATSHSTTAGAPFTITLTIKTPKWLTLNFDKALIKLSNLNNNNNSPIIHSAQGELNKPIKFLCYINTTGAWLLSKVGIQYNDLILNWNVSHMHYIINSENLASIPLSVEFPKIVTTSRPMTTTLHIDYTHILTPSCSHMVYFNDKSAVVPEQNGLAKFSDGNQCEFSIDTNGNLCFIKDGEHTDPPLLKTVSIPITFNVLDPESENTSLVIKSTIEGKECEETFAQSFKFPIQCKGRLRTEKIVHIDLQNVCNIPLSIENDSIGKHIINPFKHFYVIHETSQGPFKLLVSDGFGDPIEKVFELDEGIMWPRISASIEKSDFYTAGSAINIELDLPKCSYYLKENQNFLIVGKTKNMQFEGGKVNFKIIPVNIGTIKTPPIEIDGVLHSIHPRFINVTSSRTLSLGPFVESAI